MNAIDTNVLVYSVDSDEPLKQAAAIEFLDRINDSPAPTVLMWQVAGEFLNYLRRWERRGKVQQHDADGILTDILSGYELICPTPDAIDVALRLYARYSLSHWDSMLVAACVEAGVTTLYSEDMAHGAIYDSVTVVNPFE